MVALLEGEVPEVMLPLVIELWDMVPLFEEEDVLAVAVEVETLPPVDGRDDEVLPLSEPLLADELGPLMLVGIPPAVVLTAVVPLGLLGLMLVGVLLSLVLAVAVAEILLLPLVLAVLVKRVLLLPEEVGVGVASLVGDLVAEPWSESGIAVTPLVEEPDIPVGGSKMLEFVAFAVMTEAVRVSCGPLADEVDCRLSDGAIRLFSERSNHGKTRHLRRRIVEKWVEHERRSAKLTHE